MDKSVNVAFREHVYHRVLKVWSAIACKWTAHDEVHWTREGGVATMHACRTLSGARLPWWPSMGGGWHGRKEDLRPSRVLSWLPTAATKVSQREARMRAAELCDSCCPPVPHVLNHSAALSPVSQTDMYKLILRNKK